MKNILAALLLIFFCTLKPALAADHEIKFDYGSFRLLPVLHEGRIKPLDSFARIQLRRLNGRDHAGSMDADEWMALVLFDPGRAAGLKVFSIKNNNLKEILGLPAPQNSFSLLELQKGLQDTAPQVETLASAETATLTREQQELLGLHENALSFMQLLRSLSMVLPLDVELPTRYRDKVKDGDLTYAAMAKIEPRLTADLKKLVQQKGSDPARYTDEEKKIAALGFQLGLLRDASETSALLRILPVSWDGSADTWVSPWTLLQEGHGSPESADYLDLWKQMAAAFRDGNPGDWKTTSAAAFDHIRIRGGGDISPFKLRLEALYNRADPFIAALALYLLSAGLAGLSLLRPRPALEKPAMLALAGGVLLHVAGVLIRMIILSRPPVGTLYESLLFVSLIVAAASLFSFWRQKNSAAAITGPLAASVLLLIAPLLLPRGESMEMLVAVLNTGFWLGTHVVCITAGYGVCLLTAGMAHFYMAGRLSGIKKFKLESLQQNIYRASLVALLLTAVGTALGGIWADQSWGRFWGWDPKENGALLIVLWLVWAQHGRLSGHLTPLLYAAVMAVLNIVVALAWFGVNLLSTGLHSYGFISGIAWGLGLFCGIEIMLITGLLLAIMLRERRPHVV